MSIRRRATVGAVVVCVGLLLVVGAGSYQWTADVKHERKLARGEASEAPSSSGPTALKVIGWIAALAGSVLVGFAIRDMSREIGETQSKIETQMRMEAEVQRDPKPKR